jgi:hypothetical protein
MVRINARLCVRNRVQELPVQVWVSADLHVVVAAASAAVVVVVASVDAAASAIAVAVAASAAEVGAPWRLTPQNSSSFAASSCTR